MRDQPCPPHRCNARHHPAVGLWPGGYHGGIEQVVADLASQPVDVAHVVVGDRSREPGFGGQHPSVSCADDEVDLAVCGASAQVVQRRAGGLCEDPQVERDQRLEEAAGQRTRCPGSRMQFIRQGQDNLSEMLGTGELGGDPRSAGRGLGDVAVPTVNVLRLSECGSSSRPTGMG